MALTNDFPIPPNASPNPPFAYGPYVHAAPVTPSDTPTHDGFGSTNSYSRALYIGGAGSGNLTVVLAGDQGGTIQFIGLTAGTLLQISAREVRATGTDVTNIIALW